MLRLLFSLDVVLPRVCDLDLAPERLPERGVVRVFIDNGDIGSTTTLIVADLVDDLDGLLAWSMRSEGL